MLKLLVYLAYPLLNLFIFCAIGVNKLLAADTITIDKIPGSIPKPVKFIKLKFPLSLLLKIDNSSLSQWLGRVNNLPLHFYKAMLYYLA